MRKKIKDEKLAKKAKYLVNEWRYILDNNEKYNKKILNNNQIKNEHDNYNLKREKSVEERNYKRDEQRSIKKEKTDLRHDKFGNFVCLFFF